MSNTTYVKLYRKLLDNPDLAHNNNAFIMFTKLLLKVNWQSGKVTLGKKQLAALCNMKTSTSYRTAKYLEVNRFVTTKVTAKYTEYTVVNWKKYQNGETVDETIVEPKVNQSVTKVNTIKRIKNKELRNNNIYVETQKVYDLFIENFNRNPNLYKLTAARKAKIKTRLKDTGYDLIERAITNISRQPFYQGDNDRGWKADLEFILRSYEQVERLATQQTKVKKGIDIL